MIKDINLSDESIRNSFLTYWANNEFDNAYALLSSAGLSGRSLLASLFNGITTDIVTLENNNDPTFKANIIKVASTPPTGMGNGDVYFQID